MAQEATPSRYSGLAIASLICSVFVIPGFIPAIICGHMAKARMRKDIFLEGEKMANAGHDTRSIQAYMGHKNIQHTVRYTELSPTRFKDFWRD